MPCRRRGRARSSCSSARRSAWRRRRPRSRPRPSSAGRPRPGGTASRAVCFHATSVASGPRAHPHRADPHSGDRPCPPQRLRRPSIPRRRPPGPLPPRRARAAGLTLGVDLGRAPVTLKILLENALRHAGGGIVREEDVAALAAWRAGRRRRGRGPVHALARRAPGLHRRARGRGPRGDARRDGEPRRRPRAGEPARPRGPRHRPLRPDRRLGRRRVVRLQRRARVRAQRRALPAPALGADRVPRPARRAAGHRDHPPGQPRVPRHGRQRPRRRRRPRRVPGHARRDGLAHDDGQRRSASSATASAGSRPRRSCWASRSTSRCRAIVGVRLHGELPKAAHRDRPRARHHRDAARVRRRRRVRGVRGRRPRRRSRSPTGRRSPT